MKNIIVIVMVVLLLNGCQWIEEVDKLSRTERANREAAKTPCERECTPQTGMALLDHADTQRMATGYAQCIQTCKQNEILREALKRGIELKTKGE